MFSLRKVKMDQRKLMDNANTITDMAKVSILNFSFNKNLFFCDNLLIII